MTLARYNPDHDNPLEKVCSHMTDSIKQWSGVADVSEIDSWIRISFFLMLVVAKFKGREVHANNEDLS